MIDRLAALPAEHPSHLPSERALELRERRGLVEDAVALLQAGPLPATLQHGDLHPRNVFAVHGALRVFDFGDAQWAHALEILAVPYGYLTRLTTHAWEPVLAAYAAVWADLVAPGELEGLMPAAMTTQAVNRSQTWWDAVSTATEDELVEWGDSPRYFLEQVLEPFPPPAGPQP
jgi:Ser/Thr protein kinase RdoA (MazF antagonist)